MRHDLLDLLVGRDKAVLLARDGRPARSGSSRAPKADISRVMTNPRTARSGGGAARSI